MVAQVLTDTPAVKHRPRGLTRVTATWVADASGDVSAVTIGAAGYGKLVAVILDAASLRLGDVGNTIVTVKDAATAATIFTYDTDALRYSGTTTGDDTGGAAEDLFTNSGDNLMAAGNRILISSKTGGTLPTVGTIYYVLAANLTATTFKLSATDAGASINMGSDVSAMKWVNLTKLTSLYFRPSLNVTDTAGAALTAHADTPHVNRDIFAFGAITVGVAQGGNLGQGQIDLIFDENALGSDAVPR